MGDASVSLWLLAPAHLFRHVWDRPLQVRSLSLRNLLVVGLWSFDLAFKCGHAPRGLETTKRTLANHAERTFAKKHDGPFRDRCGGPGHGLLASLQHHGHQQTLRVDQTGADAGPVRENLLGNR